ncbi:Asp-tRNA(Asn)/Glu-tRNA(Gln) amidotransferase subunit GatA [Pseudobdellovibrio exovorus]|uniref:Glutamyl-tRNA(Gln) amidotransferase subunit A n=1 Tax=Pseudobdellovibrio exovorus JSS TaxID=1184267 RepID=M4V8F7_9BACT|nr:Asp-tRNA(Asn)/Glu-tRNA(Gln) amidotransferase subunit GatA [Pseudobdellovibrio exovorus]AGH94291.1 glutamyl-tRNA(Gln) amidotransferase, A subunit [Pseudobdellovibrio exovorus JSS]
MDLTKASFTEVRDAVQSKKISAHEVTSFFLGRVEKLNPKLNAFIAMNDKALEEAKKVDERISKGEAVGPLAGVSFGIKDLLCTRNLRTTAASKILSNFVPPYDATVVARLKSAGAIVLGKLNLDEFAMGSSNETSFFGKCYNPWNTDYVPGGSSGGSAAAQSARLTMGTIGTDTGGSIRQPANFCGIVGIKPTYGRVSRYGIVAYASSLDQAGPMVSSVADAALALEVISGHDEKDSTTSTQKVPEFSKSLTTNVKGMKIGIVKEYQSGEIHPDIAKTTERAIEELKKAGAEIVEVSIPLTQFAVPMYYLIAASEASSNLARYDGVKYGYRSDFQDLSSLSLEDFYSQTRAEGFGKEVKRRIMLGTYCLSSGYYDAYYNKACQVRRLLREQYIETFKNCDALLSPVTTSPAFKVGERSSDPLKMYLNDIFTTATNLAGLPGLSVPYGMSSEGMPIGVQLTGAHFQEQKILNIAAALEESSTVKGQVPHVF